MGAVLAEVREKTATAGDAAPAVVESLRRLMIDSGD
jgi:hypothetical protein